MLDKAEVIFSGYTISGTSIAAVLTGIGGVGATCIGAVAALAGTTGFLAGRAIAANKFNAPERTAMIVGIALGILFAAVTVSSLTLAFSLTAGKVIILNLAAVGLTLGIASLASLINRLQTISIFKPKEQGPTITTTAIPVPPSSSSTPDTTSSSSSSSKPPYPNDPVPTTVT